MPRYRLYATITVSAHAEVEADSPEDAEAMAADLTVPDLCYQCATQQEDCWAVELDGEPEFQDAEEIE